MTIDQDTTAAATGTIDVSVIVPCYNAEAFLEDCLRSIARQIGVSCEIIAINDASQDRTAEILHALSLEFDNLVVHTFAKNSGQAAGRNYGLETARGEFVTFLDSDDFYLHETALSDWAAKARADKLDMCAADYFRLTRDNELVSPVRLNIPADGVFSIATCPQLSDVSQCWQFLYRRTFIDENELRFSDRLRQREDRLFFITCLVKAGRIGNIGHRLIVYRAHDNSTMAKISRRQLGQFTVHLELLTPILEAAHESWDDITPFLTANAGRYWSQGLEYWRPILRKGVHDAGTTEGGKAAYSIDDFVMRFFEALVSVARHAGPVFEDPVSVVANGPPKLEGTVDIARIAVDIGEDNGLARLLTGKRIHLSELLSWVQRSSFDWAERAVVHYVRFNRGYAFDENTPNSDTPALHDLVDKVVLHIGMPKTGSSTMQEFLEVNRLPLLDQGVWYPDIGVERGFGIRMDRTGGHAVLVIRLLDEDLDIGALLAQQIKSLNRPIHTVVLSVENIFSERFLLEHELQPATVPGLVRLLTEAIGTPKTEIWCALRRQDRWFESYYRELMANPFNGKLFPPEEHWAMLDRFGIFDYAKILGEIEALPNVSAVKTTTVGDMRASGGSVAWLLDLLGLDDSSDFRVKTAQFNKSYSCAMAAAIKLLKKLNVRRAYASQVFVKIVNNDRLRGSRFSLITPQDWARFRKLFADQLAQYDSDFPGEAPVKIVATKDAEPLALDHEIWEMLTSAQALPEVDRDVEAMTSELDYMRASVSWRLTKPLRRGLTLLRRARRRF